MEIKTVTIVIRGTKGEAKKAVYNAAGECIAGDATAIQTIITEAEFLPKSALTEPEPEPEPEAKPTPTPTTTAEKSSEA